MQNRATRTIIGRPYEVRSNDVSREFNWQPLIERSLQQKSIFLYKVRNNIYPETINSMFELSNNGNYELRSDNLSYALKKPNTNLLKKSISYSAGRLKIKLPINAKGKDLSFNSHLISRLQCAISNFIFTNVHIF